MAVRKALIVQSGEIKAAQSSDTTKLVKHMMYYYAQNPTVQLSRVGSAGNLGAIRDTRYIPSTVATRVDRLPTPAETSNTQIVDIDQSRIDQSKTSITRPSNDKPMAYVTESGDYRAMSIEDVLDTFVRPVINTYLTFPYPVTPPQNEFYYGGTYYWYSSPSHPSGTKVSPSPIFIDTVQNEVSQDTQRSSFGLVTPTDFPTVDTEYYLYKNDGEAYDFTDNAENVRPLYITSGGDLRAYTKQEFELFVGDLYRWAVVNDPGYRLDYQIVTSSLNEYYLNYPINNTILDSTKHYTDEVGVDDYRGQKFPEGIATIIDSYYLSILRT